MNYKLLRGVLQDHAVAQPKAIAARFLDKNSVPAVEYSYQVLDRKARQIASYLLQDLKPHDRVALVLPQGELFVPSFWACLYSGVLAVPCAVLADQMLPAALGNIAAILENSMARMVLTTTKLKNEITKLGADKTIEAMGIKIRAVEDAFLRDSEPDNMPDLPDDSLAFLQYTSGSTGKPKGVVVSNGNILANMSSMNRFMKSLGGECKSLVSWLPLYHDMGLIGGMLFSHYQGASGSFISPLDFMQRPAVWLEAISKYRANYTGGPNFAFDLCVKKIDLSQVAPLDLSSLTVMKNGAEPIRHETMKNFFEKFEKFGLRREVLCGVYGLAEATLFVACHEPKSPLKKSVSASRDKLLEGVLAEGAGGDKVDIFSCGVPNDLEYVIVDPVLQTKVADGTIGEIWLRGASVAQGYWGNKELTGEIFEARLKNLDKKYLRTGDLGFVLDKALFIAGRSKDMIIIRGNNHYPQDIELTIENSDPGIRSGRTAAFSVDLEGEEKLVVVIETNLSDDSEKKLLQRKIRAAIIKNHGIEPYFIDTDGKGLISKTTSGKIQRQLTKRKWVQRQSVSKAS